EVRLGPGAEIAPAVEAGPAIGAVSLLEAVGVSLRDRHDDDVMDDLGVAGGDVDAGDEGGLGERPVDEKAAHLVVADHRARRERLLHLEAQIDPRKTAGIDL